MVSADNAALPSRSRSLWITGPWLPCLFAFVLCLLLYTDNNGFPPFAHPDEKLKAAYALGGETDFFHPMLLMESVRLASRVTGIRGAEDLHDLGRTVSAFYAALAISLLAAVAWVAGGGRAAWLVAAMASLSHFNLALAHYMKEDTALLFGLALASLAMARHLRHPRPAFHYFLGAACAVALSGKYVGALIVLFAIPVLMAPNAARAGSRWRRVSRFLLGFVPVLLIINHAALPRPMLLLSGILHEARHVSTGHHGMAVDHRFLNALEILVSHVAWPVLLLAAGYGGWIVVGFLKGLAFRNGRQSRRLPFYPLDALMAGLPVVFFAVAALSLFQFPRHFLPTIVWLHYLAAMAIVKLSSAISPQQRIQMAAIAVLTLPVVAVQTVYCANYLDQFENDSRRSLALWARKHLPMDAVVLEDGTAQILKYHEWVKFGRPMPFQIISKKWAADMGSLAQARANGVTHVAICDMAYGRFFEKHAAPLPGWERLVEARKQFYTDLLREGRLVWASVPSINMKAYTNPAIHVFEVDESR